MKRLIFIAILLLSTTAPGQLQRAGRFFAANSGAAGATSFTPASLTPKLWFDSSQNAGANGASVDSYTDYSGNSWNAYGISGQTRPYWTNSNLLKTNSICAIQASEVLSVTNAGALGIMSGLGGITIAAVTAPFGTDDYAGNNHLIYFSTTTAGNTWCRMTLSCADVTENRIMGMRRVYSDSTAYLSNTITPTLGTPIRMICTYDYANASFTYYTNGVQCRQVSLLSAGNTETNNSAVVYLCHRVTSGSVGYQGLIGELVVVPRVISSTEISNLNYYWGTKWIP